MITTWYLQSQRTWDKLCHSCIGSSFLPRGAFPEGRAYAFPQRLHAGSLEALRVSRPEAVVLAINNGNGSLQIFGPILSGAARDWTNLSEIRFDVEIASYSGINSPSEFTAAVVDVHWGGG